MTLKRKIDEKELPEHPSYEKKLDYLGLLRFLKPVEILSETKIKIFADLNSVELEFLK